jgi:ABC-type transport system substrate-binding protein
MDRRTALRVLLSGSTTALVAACNATPASPTAVPAEPTTAPVQPTLPPPATATVAAAPKPAAAQTKSGGTLRLGMVGDVSTLDGHNTTPNQFDTTWSVFDRLISYDTTLRPQPELAESWDLSSDLKQIKLNLRKGVQWHSGREFSSDDVKYNLLRVRDANLQIPTLRNQSNWFTSIETPDRYSIMLKSDLPRPAIFDFFEYFNRVDQETMEGPNAKTASIGTGPFKFVEWVQGDHLTFARNPNYWKAGRPVIDTFVASARDAQARLVQLEAGALVVAKGPAPNDFARYRSDPAYQAIIHSVSGNYFLFRSEPEHSAARQQTGAPGAELCARPAALCRYVHVRYGHRGVAAVAVELTRVRGVQAELLCI